MATPSTEERVEQCLVITLNQRKFLDAGDIEKLLGPNLFTLVETTEASAVLIDFQNVEFLSSLALNNLIIVDKKCRH